MASQIDYMIAASIFLVVFAFTVNFVTNYYSDVRSTVVISSMKSQALSLLSIADFEFQPNSSQPERLGLKSSAYRFLILVNNTQPYLINQSQSVVDLANEQASFNLTTLGFPNSDYNSTVIYDINTSSTVSYQRNTDLVKFNASINENRHKFFMVYFDDDSNFTGVSSTATDSNNITEKIYPVEEISLIQWKKINELTQLSYGNVKNSTGLQYDFNILLNDLDTGSTIMEFGESLPNRGTVVSVERLVIYQNSTAEIKSGKIIVRVF